MLSRAIRLGALVLLLGSGAWTAIGCTVLPTTISLPTLPSTSSTSSTTLDTQEDLNQWMPVGPGADRAQMRFEDATSSEMVLYRFDPALYRFHIVHQLPPLTIAAWSSALPDAQLLVNGVYFHEDNFPSGLVIASGTRIGDRQFDVDKSGVILMDHGLTLLKSAVSSTQLNAWHEAAQSYPFLIWNGMPAVATDTARVARRTIVGTDREGNVYVGVLADSALSLYSLSQSLITLPIHWQAVMNLDGGPSTGLVSHLPGRSEIINSYASVPNVFVVEKK